MPNRDRKAAELKFHGMARLCAMLALTDALYLLRARPLAMGPGDISGLNLTWDSVLALVLVGLMLLALPRRR